MQKTNVVYHASNCYWRNDYWHIENSKNKKMMITLLQHIAKMSTAAKLLSSF